MTAISFWDPLAGVGSTPFLERIAADARKKAAADPDCQKAKQDTEAFFANNPSRTLHLRPACEAEIGLFLDWPAPDQGRFILTKRFSALLQIQWAIIIPAAIPDAVFSEDGLLMVWRIAVPEELKAQTRQIAAKHRRAESAAKKRRPIRR